MDDEWAERKESWPPRLAGLDHRSNSPRIYAHEQLLSFSLIPSYCRGRVWKEGDERTVAVELEINLSVREYYERACAHVNRESTRSHTTAPVCTRISFRARAVRATVTLTTFPHPASLGRPPLRPSARRPALQCRLRWEARGKARASGDVTHCVHCDAVQRRRRFLPCSVQI